jgi:hypothetical protein
VPLNVKRLELTKEKGYLIQTCLKALLLAIMCQCVALDNVSQSPEAAMLLGGRSVTGRRIEVHLPSQIRCESIYLGGATRLLQLAIFDNNFSLFRSSSKCQENIVLGFSDLGAIHKGDVGGTPQSKTWVHIRPSTRSVPFGSVWHHV